MYSNSFYALLSSYIGIIHNYTNVVIIIIIYNHVYNLSQVVGLKQQATGGTTSVMCLTEHWRASCSSLKE